MIEWIILPESERNSNFLVPKLHPLFESHFSHSNIHSNIILPTIPLECFHSNIESDYPKPTRRLSDRRLGIQEGGLSDFGAEIGFPFWLSIASLKHHRNILPQPSNSSTQSSDSLPLKHPTLNHQRITLRWVDWLLSESQCDWVIRLLSDSFSSLLGDFSAKCSHFRLLSAFPTLANPSSDARGHPGLPFLPGPFTPATRRTLPREAMRA
jgi:hypothetical protein